MHAAFYSQKAGNGEHGNRYHRVRLNYGFSLCESAPGSLSERFSAGASWGTCFTASAAATSGGIPGANAGSGLRKSFRPAMRCPWDKREDQKSLDKNAKAKLKVSQAALHTSAPPWPRRLSTSEMAQRETIEPQDYQIELVCIVIVRGT